MRTVYILNVLIFTPIALGMFVKMFGLFDSPSSKLVTFDYVLLIASLLAVVTSIINLKFESHKASEKTLDE